MSLSDAFQRARRYGLGRLPPVDREGQDTLTGVLDCPVVRRSLSVRVLSHRQKADTIHGVRQPAES